MVNFILDVDISNELKAFKNKNRFQNLIIEPRSHNKVIIILFLRELEIELPKFNSKFIDQKLYLSPQILQHKK